ncbi:MAG: leucyl aminopeptidase [Gemmatimonadales bacterium]|nr:leucyl aminopeptidase [Gemmatimonadota bacterium]MDX2059240.1 leucyl aminopeptidase [Gemmatimonadales bacterium]
MPFTTSLTDVAAESYAGPLLIALVAQGPLPGSLAGLDARTGGALGRAYGAGDFSGKKDETVLAYPAAGPARVLLVGVGKEPTRAALRRGAAIGAKRARVLGAATAALACPAESRAAVPVADAFQSLAEGAAQGSWWFGEMKRPPEEPKPALTAIEILRGDADPAAAGRGHTVGAAIGAGQLLARGIQVLPPNVLTPARLAEAATELAGRHGMPCLVLDRAGLEREGMGAILAVGVGSAQDPRFVALEYRGGTGAPIVLIGKGITFDTGGISIKPAQSMEDMKYDMSGAAAVLGAFEAIGRLKPAINVIGLIPSAENMPSGTAYRPADVVKTHFGKTIEVVNTDAEGRLLLADALSWARKYQPAAVVDIATLTGAIGIALGQVVAGVMGNDPSFVQEVIAAGQRAHERAWELPLLDEYRDQIKSDIADVKNSGGRLAGSITAGWFLKEFVEGFPWAHLDIASTAYTDREDAALVKGPTGMGVRLFAELVLARAGA